MHQETRVFGTRRTERTVLLGLGAFGTLLFVAVGLVWWARDGDAARAAAGAGAAVGLLWLGVPLGWAVLRLFPLSDRLEVGPDGLVRHYSGDFRRIVRWGEVARVRLLLGPAGPGTWVHVETATGPAVDWAFDGAAEVARLVRAGVPPGTPVEGRPMSGAAPGTSPLSDPSSSSPSPQI